MKIFKQLFFTIFIGSIAMQSSAQEINTLVLKAKQKIEKVNDYQASGKMKTNVTFLKVPIANVKSNIKPSMRF